MFIRSGDGIDLSKSGGRSASVLRFAAYDVRERLTATRTLLGAAKVAAADLVAAGRAVAVTKPCKTHGGWIGKL